MQYFQALKIGQKRVAEAREYLNKLTDGRAMPALALSDTKSNVWQPVGEENLYAFKSFSEEEVVREYTENIKNS